MRIIWFICAVTAVGLCGCQTVPSHIRELSRIHNVYLIDDGTLFYNDVPYKQSMAIHPEKITEARILPECQPAENDPAGNWGKPDAGFQMSARLAKTEFTVGEPVSVVVYLRNISGKILQYSRTIPDLSLEITLLRSGTRQKTKREIEEDANPALRGIQQIVASNGPRYFWPSTQHREAHVLNELYDLRTPGEYAVRIGRKISYFDQTAAKPASDWARFTIVPPAATKAK